MKTDLDRQNSAQNQQQSSRSRRSSRSRDSQRQALKDQRSENLEQVAIKTNALFRQVFSSTLNRINKTNHTHARKAGATLRGPTEIQESTSLEQEEGKVLNLLDKITERLEQDTKLEARAVDTSAEQQSRDNDQYSTQGGEAEQKAQSSPDVIATAHEPADLGKLDISEYGENEISEQLVIFRARNQGAKNFDDFARGIQTWLSSLEVEAIKRFHELHIGPIEEAFEEYVTRAAMSLSDLIMKALLLAKLKSSKKGARRVGTLAMKKIQKLMEELDITVPSEMLFTWQAVKEMEAENDLDLPDAEIEKDEEHNKFAFA